MGFDTRQLSVRINYLFLEEGLWLTLAVRLDTANVVGCCAMKDL